MSYPRGGVRGKSRGYKGVRQYTEDRTGLSRSEDTSKHDNNCCQDVTIDMELSQVEVAFFTELKTMWNMLKRSPPVVSKLHHYLNNSDNPYVAALKLACNCQEYYSAKSKTLPMFIMEELKFLVTLSRQNFSHKLTPQLKIDAFKIIMTQNALTLTKLVVEIFEMIQDRDMFLEVVRCMVDKKQYNKACQYATLLNLQNEFTIHDFLVPLVIQDKLFCIDEFLKESPKHQIELIEFLDSVLGNPSIRDVLGDIIAERRIPGPKYEKLHAKPWKKLIARFLKMFKLSQDLTPNLNKRRNEGALSFLLHKRFMENTFGEESWKEMVQEAVGSERELQKELVCQIAQYGETAEALKWAHFYNIEKNDWPHSVRMLEENPDGERKQQKLTQPEVCWDEQILPTVSVEFHTLKLPISNVHLVDDPLKFENFLDAGVQNIDILGIDCEWKPSFGGQMNELALMQIATRTDVYVLDIINLGNKVPLLWRELGKFVFDNCDIFKLGFNLIGDIHMIRQALPDLNFSHKQTGFLDLCALWKHLDRFPKFKFPYEVQKGGPSLSTLVQHSLGCTLDKSDQFSNWEKRPLRDSQIKYAALDAYCLIEVYDVIKRCCDDAKLSFDEICYHLMTNEKSTRKKSKKHATKHKHKPVQDIVQPPSPHPEPVQANRIKVVCDTMLQGLGKKLRSCGIDTAILENCEDHMICVKYAQDEQRYILTRGYENFKKLYGYVPLGCCLKILSDNVEEQLREVLDYYKILVTKDHVFSRCQTCNGNNFVKVSKSTMSALVQSTESRMTVPPPCYYEDEATGFSSEDEYDEFERAAPVPTSTRKWDLCPDEKVDVGLCQTRLGAKIEVKVIPGTVLEKYDFFYVCEECGKVYWDGSHFEKVLSGRLLGIVQ